MMEHGSVRIPAGAHAAIRFERMWHSLHTDQPTHSNARKVWKGWCWGEGGGGGMYLGRFRIDCFAVWYAKKKKGHSKQMNLVQQGAKRDDCHNQHDPADDFDDGSTPPSVQHMPS